MTQKYLVFLKKQRIIAFFCTFASAIWLFQKVSQLKRRVMGDRFEFTNTEREETVRIWKKLRETIGNTLKTGDEQILCRHIGKAVTDGRSGRQ